MTTMHSLHSNYLNSAFANIYTTYLNEAAQCSEPGTTRNPKWVAHVNLLIDISIMIQTE